MPTPMIIDPLHLTSEQEGVLDRFFAAEEERKKGDTDKIKVFENGFKITLISEPPTGEELEIAEQTNIPIIAKDMTGTRYMLYVKDQHGHWRTEYPSGFEEIAQDLFPSSAEIVRESRCFVDTPLMDLLKKFHTFPDIKQKKYVFEDHDLCFLSPVIRRKERYKRILTLNAPPLPDDPEPNTLYVIYNQDGGADVYGVRDKKDIQGIEDEKPIHVPLTTQQLDSLKKECSVYLMKTPESGVYKPSQPYHLYLYKDENGIFFVDANGDKYHVRQLPTELIQIDFTQPSLNPQKFDDKKLCNIILKKTSEQHKGAALRGITFREGRPITDLKKISKVMRECGKPINQYVYDICDEQFAHGAFSEIYRVRRRLDHVGNGMLVREYLHPKILKRTPIPHNKQYARILTHAISEPKFWIRGDEQAPEETSSHTQKATVKKMDDGTVDATYMLQDEFSGVSLRSIIEEDKLSVDQRYQLTFKLLEALQILHNASIIHRDIKPDNIIVMIQGQNISVRITDFNLSKDKDSYATSAGTPGYIAPEIASGRASYIKVEQDIYSMGVLLRKLWKDKTIENKKNIVEKSKKEMEYSSAEDFLQVSMKAFSSSKINKLDREKRIEINYLLNAMTKTDPAERLDLDKFLKQRKAKLENKPFVDQPREDKHPQTYRTRKAESVSPLSLLDKNEKLALLSETLENHRVLLKSEPAPLKELLYRIDLLKSNSDNLTSANLDKAIKLVADALLLAKNNPNDEQIKIKVNALKECMKPSYREFMRRAWNKTFRFDNNVIQVNETKKSFKDSLLDFVGWPKKGGKLAKFLSVFPFGLITIPKNIVKFCLELPLTLAADTFDFLSYKANQSFSMARYLGAVPAKFISLLLETPRFFLRTITSPIANMKECGVNDAYHRCKDELTFMNVVRLIGKTAMGLVSGACTVAVLGTLFAINTPIIAPLLTAVGILTLPVLVATPTILSIGVPAVTGAVVLNGLREFINDAKGSAAIAPDAPIQAQDEAKQVNQTRERVPVEQVEVLKPNSPENVARLLAESSGTSAEIILQGNRLTTIPEEPKTATNASSAEAKTSQPAGNLTGTPSSPRHKT